MIVHVQQLNSPSSTRSLFSIHLWSTLCFQSSLLCCTCLWLLDWPCSASTPWYLYTPSRLTCPGIFLFGTICFSRTLALFTVGIRSLFHMLFFCWFFLNVFFSTLTSRVYSRTLRLCSTPVPFTFQVQVLHLRFLF